MVGQDEVMLLGAKNAKGQGHAWRFPRGSRSPVPLVPFKVGPGLKRVKGFNGNLEIPIFQVLNVALDLAYT